MKCDVVKLSINVACSVQPLITYDYLTAVHTLVCYYMPTQTLLWHVVAWFHLSTQFLSQLRMILTEKVFSEIHFETSEYTMKRL